jgi:GntR family transcriptional regulator, transcriptional repressor for pyruvate dehydrogenase complex
MTRATATRKTHEVVADQLRQRIVSGELKAGDRLPPEEELTEQFGVARTSLREALRVLESQGLLSIRRGRGGGPVVTHPDLSPAATALAMSLQLQNTTVGDLDAARRLIEIQIVGQLARDNDTLTIAKLEAAVETAHTAAERNNPKSFVAAAAAMHETIMELSGNNTLTMLSKLLHVTVRAYYARSVSEVDQVMMRRAVKSYRKLIELIRAGNAGAAMAHWDAQMIFTVSGSNPDSPLLWTAG